MRRQGWLVRLAVIVTAVTGVLGGAAAPAAAATFPYIPPFNDQAGYPTFIRDTDYPYRAYLDTRGATVEANDPTCAGSGTNVWYVVVGTGGPVTIQTYGSNYDTTLSVYLGAQLACNDDAGGTTQSEITIDTVPGYEYDVMVAAKAGEPGGLLLFTALLPGQTPPDVVPPPPNDQIYDATEISALPYADQVDTRGANAYGYESGYCGTWKSVWYHYRPAADARVFFDTFGSDYDTALSVYQLAADNLVEIACNDDAGIGGSYYQSRLEVDVLAGVDYYILVTEPFKLSTPQGGTLRLNAGAAVPFAIDVSVDATASLSRRQLVATVTGTATCTRPSTLAVTVALTQPASRITTTGNGFSSVDCSPATPAQWLVDVPADSGRWRPGQANAVVDVQGDSFGQTATAHAEATVTLRNQP
jgi:hypothetical protein